MTIADQSGDTPDAFVIVVNDLGQHALWQAELDVPRGWRRQSPVMSRSQCLEAVAGSWRDIAPLTARASARALPGADGGRFVHERFADQAARRPDANAIVAGRTRMTYRELDESAGRLADYLAAAGVGREKGTGVQLGRGADLITAILAIRKAGRGSLPLYPAFPSERLTRICAQVSPLAVITDVRSGWQVPGTRLLPLGELAVDLADRPATGPGTRPHPDNLCYVIYTSGSTGDPKAVAVSFGSMACVIGEMAREYQTSEEDRVGQVAAMAFDTFLEQVFTALTAGASLTLPPHGTVAPSELLRGVERKQVTVLDLTPAYWHQVLALTHPDDERLRSVRLMITGGEMADPADCRAALRAAPWARLLNAYGLTETTITSAVFDIGAWLPTAEPHAAVPVGRPSGHARIMVLDGELNPVPAGTAGGIYIGGGGGGRVEPGEIESVLAGHPDIDQVSVVASMRGSGDTRLVAYYTPSAAAAAETALHHPPAASLRHYLLDRLPGYMVPAAFIPRHHLPPGTGQGPDGQHGHGHSHGHAHAHGPGERHTPTQAGLSALWARLLGQDHVGLDDDFFALGGNSLLAAEMLAHTRSIFGIPADSVRPLTRCLLRDPTLRGFSAAAADARAGRPAAAGAPAGG